MKIIRDFSIDRAITNALQTQEEIQKEEDRIKYEIDWEKRAESSDIKVSGAAFKERWVEIEPLLAPDEKRRLKKKFNIK